VKFNVEGSILNAKAKLENTSLKVTGTGLSLSGDIGLGSNKASGRIDVLKGDANINLTNGTSTFNGKLTDGSGEVSKGNVSLSNSLELGLSGKYGEVEFEASVDLYKIGAALTNYAEAGVEWTKGKLLQLWPQ